MFLSTSTQQSQVSTDTLECSIMPMGDIPPATLQRLLPGEAESGAFYDAVEPVPPKGFRLAAMVAKDHGRPVAVVPLFEVSYRLDTPMQGSLRRVGDWLNKHAPRLVSLPVLGLGSPMSDNLTVGFAANLSQGRRRRVFDALVRELLAEAGRRQDALVAIKSMGGLAAQMDPVLTDHGFNKVTSVPLVMLDLPFRDLDHYLASLPAKDRSYLKRKNRTAGQVRMEYRTSVAGIEAQVYELFQATLANSSVDYGEFEQLDPSYFSRVMEGVGDDANLMLCWRGDELVSFHLNLLGRDRVVAKQIGMKYPMARELNLYFVNWLEAISHTIKLGIPRIEMGATTYASKLLFGGHIERRWLHFRFRGGLANSLLWPAGPLFDFERNDAEIRKLTASGVIIRNA